MEHHLSLVGKSTAYISYMNLLVIYYACCYQLNALRLIHPFSPRGKLIHFGLPALEQANDLISRAATHYPECILRHHLYRVALSSKNVEQIEYTAEHYPELATRLSQEEMNEKFGGIDSLGGLKLNNGCKVIHVPSYLKGLWNECEMKAEDVDGSIKWELVQTPEKGDTSFSTNRDSLNEQLAQFDAVVLSAGSGILHDKLINKDHEQLPVQLVRGQSIEMTMPNQGDDTDHNDAFLCGKYLSPLPTDANESSRRFVIGATHEFKYDPLSPEEVQAELKSRTYQFTKQLWDHGITDRMTSGVRMQSNRGAFGRMPIIGRYNSKGDNASIRHDKLWMFTGLSSRGLMYHTLTEHQRERSRRFDLLI